MLRSSNFQDISITRTHRRIIAGQTGLIVTDLFSAFSLTQEGGGGGEVRDGRQGSTLFRTPRAASYQQVRSLGVYFGKASELIFIEGNSH